MSHIFPSRLTLLTTQTGAAASTLTFTSVINSNYSTYYLKLRDVNPASGDTLAIQFSSDNGATWLTGGNYITARQRNNSNDLYANEYGANTLFYLLDTNTTTTTIPINFEIIFYNLNNGTNLPLMMAFQSSSNGNNVNRTWLNMGVYNTATAINAVKVYFDGGTITGTGKFYGCNAGGIMY